MRLINVFIYTKNINKGYVIVRLYMDNMLILSKKEQMIKFTKKKCYYKILLEKLVYCGCHTRK